MRACVPPPACAQVPLDNFVSRGKERFLTSTTPDYQASVYAMVRHSLAGDLEAEERSIVPAAKLMEAVLQNCRGAVDKWVAPYLALATGKLATATNRTLRVSAAGGEPRALHHHHHHHVWR